MMRRVVTWGPVAVTVAAGGLLLGAEPIPPKAVPPLPVPPVVHRTMPPLPVPPVERQAIPPFLARLTFSGDPRTSGEFEECVDLAATSASARARAQARPADAPSPLTGCVTAHEMRPGGVIHNEMSCDRAKGAKASFRIVSDGTPNDLRTHVERSDPNAAAGAPKITITDSHLVRLGPCPADLKPGQMRRPGGPIIERDKASRVLDGARGAAE